MKEKLESNLKLIMLMNIFCEPFFWGAILITTLQKLAHMSLPEIYTQEAVCIVVCFLVDIPTGALSDIVGRKKVLVAGSLFYLASFMFFAFMSAPWHTWVANILWAISAALESGTDKAMLQETCIALEKEDSFYRKFSGKIQGRRLLIMAVCAPVTSWLASYDLRLPLLLSIPTLIIPIVCGLKLTEPPRVVRELTAKEQIKQMGDGFWATWNNKNILWLTGYACVISVTSKIWFFMYNPYFEYVGVKVSDFGYVFFALNLLAWLSSRYGHALEKKIGDSGTVWMLVPMIGVPLLLMAFYPYPTMAYMVLFQSIVRGMYGPFFDNLTGKFLKDETRATVMSVQSSTIGVAASLGLWVFGFLVNSLGILSSLKVLGLSALLGYFILMCFWSKLFKKSQ